MSRILADTQILVWLADKPESLPRAAARMLTSTEHEIFFSLASIWEISIKFALGRPDFTMDPAALVEGLLEYGFQQLPIARSHVLAVSRLSLFHRDPFDRLLVAQAQVEGLTLITADRKLEKYGPHVTRL